jgi:rhomboid family protein
MIIAACGGAFALELMAGPRVGALIEAFGLIPARFTAALQGGALGARGGGPDLPVEALTLVTSMFLHGGWMHVLGNLWFLHVFGDNVEDAMGHFRYPVFYLLTGLVAAGLHVGLNPNSPVPTVGASGAISGIMGAYLVLFPHARVVTLVPIVFYVTFLNLPAVFFLGYWFLIQFLSGGMELAAGGAGSVGGTAWWAHIGGFGAGLILALPFAAGRQRRPDYRDTSRL